MLAVITGDIINSRKTKPENWLLPLQALLKDALAGHQKKNKPEIWEFTRGDTFQIELANPENSLLTALLIKATLKSLEVKDLDARMAIGLGDKTYKAKRVSESTGSAFIYSGEKFETLKSIKQTIAIKSNSEPFDETLNLMFKLGLTFMDKWTASSAELMQLILLERIKGKETILQKDLKSKLKLQQSSISERQTRAHADEVLELDKYFRKKLAELMP